MSCGKCDAYKKEVDKYKKKYEIAKSGLTLEEREMIIELICNEQIKHILTKNEYETERYKYLENLKVKIRTV